MTENVLSIEQCKILLNLGVDMSDASCVWTSIVDKDYNPVDWLPVFRSDKTSIEILQERFPLTYKEGNIYYTYTLNDLLKKIDRFKLYDYKNACINSIFGSNPLEAAYNLFIKEYVDHKR